MKMELTECSETSEYKIQMPGNYPEESIQHSEHGESFKSRRLEMLWRQSSEFRDVISEGARNYGWALNS